RVVEGRIAAREGLELVVEVEDDLVQRQLVLQDGALRARILERDLRAAPLLAEREDPSQELVLRDDRREDVRLAHLVDELDVRELDGVRDLELLPARGPDLVGHGRRRRDEREVELALEALLDDLHVEEAEVSAAEAEAERRRRLGLEREGRIVEAQLLHRVA